jgi:glycosyltransferase involved in cell wall biosynthesis
MSQKIVVAIPVRDEEQRIGLCLNALAQQTVPADEIILLLNNCEDATFVIAQTFAQHFRHLNIIECQLQGEAACAGEARRRALDTAATRGDIILTSDADATVPPDWIARTVGLMEHGAEVVCGQIDIDPADASAMPQALHHAQALEHACAAAIDHLVAVIDPDPADPWPRHQENSGASIGVTAAAFARAGGLPAVRCGEDRALIAALRRVDARIRHAPQLRVTVSGRLDGRAPGGMAATLQRRLGAPDEWADEALEPAIDAYRRGLARARLRRLWQGVDGAQVLRVDLPGVDLPGVDLPGVDLLGVDLLVGGAAIREALTLTFFGQAWNQVEALSPVLARRRLHVSDLAREVRRAAQLRAHYVTQMIDKAQYAD